MSELPLAELQRLARSRPKSGRGLAAKAAALRTLERLERGKAEGSVAADSEAVARLFDPARDPSEQVRPDDWHPDPDSQFFDLDLAVTVAFRRGQYRNLEAAGEL